MRDHRKLRVFGQADALVKRIHRESHRFAPCDRTVLAVQLRRAVLSVATNIVEGSARRSGREYASFINIALGSACETRYLVQLCGDLEVWPPDVRAALERDCGDLVAGLHKLRDSLEDLEPTKPSSKPPNARRPPPEA